MLRCCWIVCVFMSDSPVLFFLLWADQVFACSLFVPICRSSFMTIINLWDYLDPEACDMFRGYCGFQWGSVMLLLFGNHHQKKSPVSQSCFFPPLEFYIPFRECWGLSQLYIGEGRINPWMNCQLRCRARLEHLGVPYLGNPPRVSWWWGGGSFLLAHFPFFVYPGTWIRNPLLLSPVFYCLSCHSLNFN